MNDYKKEMGMRIRVRRKKLLLTQEEIAEQLGVSVKHFSEVERGLTGLSIENLIKLSDILGISLDYIIKGEADKCDWDSTLSLLERVPKYELTKPVSDLWVTLDEIMRDTLESLDKSEIEKVLKSYVSIRRAQEHNGKIRRRLGDRRTIHPDDYKKLTKVFESMEEKDFSVISLFR